jgi:hypothetical protein
MFLNGFVYKGIGNLIRLYNPVPIFIGLIMMQCAAYL